MPPIHLVEWDTVVCDLEVTDTTNTSRVGQLSVSLRSQMPPVHLVEWDTVVCVLKVTDALQW